MIGVLLPSITIDPVEAKFSKSLIWTDVFLGGNSQIHIE